MGDSNKVLLSDTAPATSMFDLDTADAVGVINRNSRRHSDQRCAIQLIQGDYYE